MCYGSIPIILCLKKEARCLKFTAVVFSVPYVEVRMRVSAMPFGSVFLTLAQMN